MGAEINLSEIKELFEEAKNIGELALEYLALDYWTESVEEAPIKRGTLRGSIQAEQVSIHNWIIGTNLEYALYVHEGTRSYPITAQSAEALGPLDIAFSYLGVSHSGYGFFKSVQHPGIEGNPFFDRTTETVEGRIEEFIGMAVAEVGG